MFATSIRFHHSLIFQNKPVESLKGSTLVVGSLPYLQMLFQDGSELQCKHSSLLRYDNNYGCKMFFITGAKDLKLLHLVKLLSSPLNWLTIFLAYVYGMSIIMGKSRFLTTLRIMAECCYVECRYVECTYSQKLAPF